MASSLLSHHYGRSVRADALEIILYASPLLGEAGRPALKRGRSSRIFDLSSLGRLRRCCCGNNERWRAQIDHGSPPRIPTSQEGSRWDRYGSSMVADSKHIYVASRDSALYALDLATGKEQWRVATKDMMTATPALYRDTVLFADYKGLVRAVGASDGKLRWTYDAKLPVAGDLVVDADRVFVGSRTYDLIALDAANGKELWKHYYWFSWIESPPVVRDGKLRWKAPVPGWAWPRTAVSDQLVVETTVGQGAYPGIRGGTIRWMYLDPPSADTLAKKAEWGFGAASTRWSARRKPAVADSGTMRTAPGLGS